MIEGSGGIFDVHVDGTQIWSKGDIELVKKTGERVQRAAKAILEALGAKAEDAAE